MKKNDELFDSLQLLEKPKTKSKSTLTVYDVRTLSGCLLRVPEHFYTTIWHILTKVKGGIQIKDQHMPQEPTITHMARYLNECKMFSCLLVLSADFDL